MKVYTVIPCRSGSKRIKDKNLYTFNGESLLRNSLGIASNSTLTDKIIVSTDSSEYLKEASDFEILDIGLRSQQNSSDYATDLDLFSEIHNRLLLANNAPDIYVHLRPTYPALSPSILDYTIKFFIEKTPSFTSLKSIQKIDLFHEKIMKYDPNTGIITSANGNSNLEESYLPAAKCTSVYAQTAAVDIYLAENLANNNLWGSKCLGFEVGDVSADIDTLFDIPSAYHAYDSMHFSPSKPARICFDIDGVLVSRVSGDNYKDCKPNKAVIDLIHHLKAIGCEIIICTARGSKTKKDWEELTLKQLHQYNVPYDEVNIGNKPHADFYIDDRSTNLYDLATLFDFKT